MQGSKFFVGTVSLEYVIHDQELYQSYVRIKTRLSFVDMDNNQIIVLV